MSKISKIIIYTKSGCPWCVDVLAFLDSKNIKYENREVRGNKEYYKELVDKSGQDKTPTLDIEGDILSDTDKEAVENWLTKKSIL